jgi:hypothetical protein
MEVKGKDMSDDEDKDRKRMERQGKKMKHGDLREKFRKEGIGIRVGGREL